jgi:hypothetical protein
MSERRSIWVRYDCKISADGPTCTLCCLLLNIVATSSPKDSECRFQTADGCSIHADETFPDECLNWHCSMMSGNMWYYFYGQAAKHELITQEECADRRKLLIIS